MATFRVQLLTKFFRIYCLSAILLLAAIVILLTPARSYAEFQMCMYYYTFDKDLFETFAKDSVVSCTKEKGKTRLELRDTFFTFSASTGLMPNTKGGQSTVCLMESASLGIYDYIEIRGRDKTLWNKFIASQCAMMMSP
jgi:hypothetical protein